MAIDRFKAPVLPMPPREYDLMYFNQLVRTIGTTFRAYDSRSGMNTTSMSADVVRMPIGLMSLDNGVNNNAGLPAHSFVRVIDITANYSITGFNGGVDGRYLLLYNGTPYRMALMSLNAGSAAGNQIFVPPYGADLVCDAYSIVPLIYSILDGLWIAISPTGDQVSAYVGSGLTATARLGTVTVQV